MKKIVTFSFDDGYKYDFNISEILVKNGLKATFYIATKHSHNPLLPAEIRELSAIAEIGSHTTYHNRLDLMDYNSQKNEIETNKKYLEGIIGKEIKMFCPPKGFYNTTTLKIVKELDFVGMRTTKDFQIKIRDPFQIPTSVQLYPHTKTIFLYHLVKYNPKYLFHFLPHIKELGLENILHVFNKIINKNGGVLHIWGHSWEIEKLDLLEKFKNTIELVSKLNFIPYYNSEIISK